MNNIVMTQESNIITITIQLLDFALLPYHEYIYK